MRTRKYLAASRRADRSASGDIHILDWPGTRRKASARDGVMSVNLIGIMTRGK